jgi:lysophospholipase L1-like esterase
MNKHLWYFSGLLSLIMVNSTVSFSQKVPWDDVQSKKWPSESFKVELASQFDGSMQPAVAYKAWAANRPLLISLHTWSGDYLQEDSLVIHAIEADYNYIHPHFRGPNNQPMACGSKAAMQDLEDAIEYGIKVMGANPDEVHIIGVSGGGYMTVICYMQLKFPVMSFSSWVGISNLGDWYYESKGRRQKYADDILKSLGKGEIFDAGEAQKRSPIFQKPSMQKGSLHLYAGIHDGYQGPVPVSQTLQFYNKVVADLYPKESKALIREQTIVDILASQTSRKPYPYMLGDRQVHLFQKKGPVSITIFEGKHEMVVPVALQLVPVGKSDVFKKQNVLGIGDSNGANEQGWITQLQKSIPWATVINDCKGGRTIGFDNNGDSTLNELKLLTNHLKEGAAVFQNRLDWIVIALGTNDAKAVFAGKEETVVQNFKTMLDQVFQFKKQLKSPFRVLVILPPPISAQADTSGKYEGGAGRLDQFRKAFTEIAGKAGATVLDSYGLFENEKESFTTDGIHLNAVSQAKWARAIIRSMH